MSGFESRSPKADRATLDKVGKLLPLLNSDVPAEVQAAAAALAKFDLRDVAATLVLQTPAWWNAKQERQLRLERLQKTAQDLLDQNNPLLTAVHRKSLNKIVQLRLHENESRAKHDLDYWSGRVRIIRWQITPGAKRIVHVVLVVIVIALGLAQTALAKAIGGLRQLDRDNQE
jgi:hypothetical protein